MDQSGLLHTPSGRELDAIDDDLRQTRSAVRCARWRYWKLSLQCLNAALYRHIGGHELQNGIAVIVSVFLAGLLACVAASFSGGSIRVTLAVAFPILVVLLASQFMLLRSANWKDLPTLLAAARRELDTLQGRCDLLKVERDETNRVEIRQTEAKAKATEQMQPAKPKTTQRLRSCPDCGVAVSVRATVCPSCGAPTRETAPQRLTFAVVPQPPKGPTHSVETVVWSGHPAMFGNHPVGFLICLLLVPVGIGLVILIVWALACTATTLTVTNRRTILRRGILAKRTTEVRHADVRNIVINQGFFERLFSVGTLGVSSAGQGGIEIAVSGIPSPQKVASSIRQFQD